MGIETLLASGLSAIIVSLIGGWVTLRSRRTPEAKDPTDVLSKQVDILTARLAYQDERLDKQDSKIENLSTRISELTSHLSVARDWIRRWESHGRAHGIPELKRTDEVEKLFDR